MVIAQVSKTSAFEFTSPSKVLDAKLNIFALNDYFFFLLMQSNLHVQWAWKYSSTMKTDLSYAPTQVFETFPFIKDISNHQMERLNQIGKKYYDFRKELMSSLGLGLTKTYNLFHNKHIVELTIQDESLDDNTFEKKFGKNSLNFRKHLIKHSGAKPYNARVKDILNLRKLHMEIDNAALSYFGWADIDLRHDFYDVEYLSENDRNRFTIHPIARKEILKRLLQLNHDLYNRSELDKQSDNKRSKNLPIADFFTELG